MHLAEEFANIMLDEDFSLQSIKMALKRGVKSDQISRLLSEQGWRALEPPMPEILAKLVRQSAGLVIDVGANSGFYSLLSAAANQKVSIIAFEPDPHVRPLLKKNIAANMLETRIAVSHLALSDKIGTGKLYIPTQEHGLVETSSSLDRTFKEQHSEIIEISVATLDSTLGKWGYEFNQVSLMKIDVEGHEAAVIRGAEHLIKRCRPYIFIEVLPRADLKCINQFLENNGYKDIRLPPDGITEAGDQVFFDPSSWNHVLTPAEKLDEIAASLS